MERRRNYERARARFRKKHGFVVPYATLFLTFLTVFIYFLFSRGQPYIYPILKLWKFGVIDTNLLGAVSYSFVHIGLRHLLGNIIVLLAVGSVLEQKIGGKHMLGIYALSGILSGFFYALLFPGVWVIGASAAIAGLLATAYLADFKKTSIAILVVILLIPNFAFPTTEQALDSYTQEQVDKQVALVEQAEELQRELDAVQLTLTQEDITEAERQALAEKEVGLSTEIQIVQEEEEEVATVEESVSEGRKTESTTPVSVEMHLLGILFALVYAYFFTKGIFTNFKDDIYGIIKFGNKKSRRRTRKSRR